MPILKVKSDPPSSGPTLKVKDTAQEAQRAPAPPPPARREPPTESFQPRQSQRSHSPKNGTRPIPIQDAPPHSDEAELGVLSSIMSDCQFNHTFDVMAEVAGSIQPWFFYVPANKTIYEVMLSLYRDQTQIDLITFTQILRDRKLLDSIGGPSYVTNMVDFVPTAANVQFYIEIMRDKFILRETIAIGTRVTRAAYGAQDDEAAEILADFSLKIDRVKAHAGWANGTKPLMASDLKEMDGKPDPNNLVGWRWMCRGGNCLWSGGAGYGKSTLMAQFATTWAKNSPCFGVRPVRALKSLIIQSENDDFDVAEQYNGVLSGMDLTAEERELVDKNVIYVRVEAKSGSAFLSDLERLLNLYRPDLSWIDPLFAFAGCDLMDAAKTGYFLREGLFPLFVKFKCCGNIIHHISKPPKEEKGNKATIDYQYSAFGSSEIQNAFRAVNSIHPINFADQIYKLVFSKRGRRARAKNTDGGVTSQIFIQQSDDPSKIFWSQVEEPEKPKSGKANARKYTEDDVLEYMGVATGWKTAALQKLLRTEEGMVSSTFYGFFKNLKDKKKIRCEDGEWFRNSSTNDPETTDNSDTPN